MESIKNFIIGLYQILHTVQDDPLWDDVYVTTFWFMVMVTLLFTIFYYYFLNNKYIDKFKTSNWITIGVISALFSGIVSLIVCFAYFDFSYFIQIIFFFLINVIYSSILYIGFSFAMFRWSKHAANTPFYRNKLKGDE
jgi:hypothetical protein